MNSTFDPTAIAAAELLSLFGKNTAIRIDHKYGADSMNVVSAKTGNVIAVVDRSANLQAAAVEISNQKNFPKPRNMKRSWSPIRLSGKAEAMLKADSGMRFA